MSTATQAATRIGYEPAPGTFALATFARPDGSAYAALVLPEGIVELAGAQEAARPRRRLADATDLVALLQDWDGGFEVLQEIAAFVTAATLQDERLTARSWGQDRVLAPLLKPSKMLNAAQNYPDHVQEMRAARDRGFNAADIDEQRDFTGDKAKTRPYLFLKAPSALTGAYDDIALPAGASQIDWEVELAVAIGRRGRSIPASRATEHIAGYMTTNDVSCRDLLFRPDRERLRSDWLGGKSHDGFAPMGPVLVPKAFVPDHLDLRLRLSVNGAVRQDGNTGHLIFSPEEQIEYVSAMTTLEPGDVFATGTPGGVGQGSDTFLKAGDVVEAEVQGLGTLRNRFVAAPPALGSEANISSPTWSPR